MADRSAGDAKNGCQEPVDEKRKGTLPSDTPIFDQVRTLVNEGKDPRGYRVRSLAEIREMSSANLAPPSKHGRGTEPAKKRGAGGNA